MHNLFLGTAKHFLKNLLIAGDHISSTDMEIVQKRVNASVVPSGIGRIPLKIESGFTADQWKNWVLYYSIVALRGVVTGEYLECWQHFVLACRVLCVNEITLERAKLGDAEMPYLCSFPVNMPSHQTCIYILIFFRVHYRLWPYA